MATCPACSPEAFVFVYDILRLRTPDDLGEQGREECRRFVMKVQQLSGPVMAKGLEDTAFYNYNRLISLNEVGGDPGRFGTDIAGFHAQNHSRAEHWPGSLLATSTHDTKRGEDLRARVNVLSEIPEEWCEAALKWSRLNAGKKTLLDGEAAPDLNDEYFLYQTLVGAWINEAETADGSERFRQRLCDYMLKALREAKNHTSWTNPNEAYEQATQKFVEEILSHSKTNPFLDDFMLFQRKVAFFGLFNSLAQTVLKMTCPGVPDFYRGTELWDYNLVDPDNRRPVDFALRKALLTDLRDRASDPSCDSVALVKLLFKNHQNGHIKLYLIWRTLELRGQRSQLFKAGSYVPLYASGSKQEHLCAFARSHLEESVITVAARLVVGLTKGSQRAALDSDVWLETTLPVAGGKAGDQYRNIFTQQVITLRPDGLPIPEVLGVLPVAVLEKVG
jgi:(1->4)-alpha-D-glucan 1-alpha-D-glucosylmutase